VLNLLSNAFKFTLDADQCPTAPRKRGGRAGSGRFGVGMPPASCRDYLNVFIASRYPRSHPRGIRHRLHCTGAGQAPCGDIEVASVPGEGTTFRISLRSDGSSARRSGQGRQPDTLQIRAARPFVQELCAGCPRQPSKVRRLCPCRMIPAPRQPIGALQQRLDRGSSWPTTRRHASLSARTADTGLRGRARRNGEQALAAARRQRRI